MTEKEKKEAIKKVKEDILADADDLIEARKRGSVEGIYNCAQYIISDYAWLETYEKAPVD